MTDHTLGPWKYDDSSMFANHSESGPAQRVYAEIECTCRPNHDFAIRYVPFTQADVRLVAAAPELLETLEAIANYSKHGRDSDGEAYWHSVDAAMMNKMAKRAIARATGEE